MITVSAGDRRRQDSPLCDRHLPRHVRAVNHRAKRKSPSAVFTAVATFGAAVTCTRLHVHWFHARTPHRWVWANTAADTTARRERRKEKKKKTGVYRLRCCSFSVASLTGSTVPMKLKLPVGFDARLDCLINRYVCQHARTRSLDGMILLESCAKGRGDRFIWYLYDTLIYEKEKILLNPYLCTRYSVYTVDFIEVFLKTLKVYSSDRLELVSVLYLYCLYLYLYYISAYQCLTVSRVYTASLCFLIIFWHGRGTYDRVQLPRPQACYVSHQTSFLLIFIEPGVP